MAGMPVRTMDHWTRRSNEQINKKINELQSTKVNSKRKLLEEKREDFYKANGIKKDLDYLIKLELEVKKTYDSLLNTLDFLIAEQERDINQKGKGSYSYGFSTPKTSYDFKEKFDKLILVGFEKWWKDNTEEGRRIKDLEEAKYYVADIIHSSSTSEHLMKSLNNLMSSIGVNKFVNGSGKPLLQKVNEVVAKS